MTYLLPLAGGNAATLKCNVQHKNGLIIPNLSRPRMRSRETMSISHAVGKDLYDELAQREYLSERMFCRESTNGGGNRCSQKFIRANRIATRKRHENSILTVNIFLLACVGPTSEYQCADLFPHINILREWSLDLSGSFVTEEDKRHLRCVIPTSSRIQKVSETCSKLQVGTSEKVDRVSPFTNFDVKIMPRQESSQKLIQNRTKPFSRSEQRWRNTTLCFLQLRLFL